MAVEDREKMNTWRRRCDGVEAVRRLIAALTAGDNDGGRAIKLPSAFSIHSSLSPAASGGSFSKVVSRRPVAAMINCGCCCWIFNANALLVIASMYDLTVNTTTNV